MRFVAALSAASMLVSASIPATANRFDPETVHVAIYRGPASCDDCSEALARTIMRISPRYHVDFVGPKERTDISPATLRHYRIYVQPGGGQDIDGALNSLGDARVRAIRQFVARGGGYLGLCMGAYLAGASNIGLIADDPDSEVRRPGFSVATIEDAAVPVRWAGRAQSMYYQDGPFLKPQRADPAYRALATYQNGDVAAARYSRGKGTVVLSGPHPEADRSWFEDADLPLAAVPGGAPFKTLMDQFGT